MAHRGRDEFARSLSVLWTALLAAMAGCASRSGPTALLYDWQSRAAEADIGRLPQHWTPLVTNGDVARTTWQTVADTKSPDGGVCLALVRNENGPGQFNLCVREHAAPADVEVSAACRGDYGVGVVWRCRDADNYYVCWVNPMEGNLNLYRVVNGQRTRLTGAPLERFEDDQWYYLRVMARGDQIRCFLNDRLMIETRDSAAVTAGRCGVWTRADARGFFRDIQIKRLS